MTERKARSEKSGEIAQRISQDGRQSVTDDDKREDGQDNSNPSNTLSNDVRGPGDTELPDGEIEDGGWLCL